MVEQHRLLIELPNGEKVLLASTYDIKVECGDKGLLLTVSSTTTTTRLKAEEK